MVSESKKALTKEAFQWNAPITVCSWNMDVFYGLGMDVVVSACFWNTNGILVWEWILCSAYALGARTELWFEHECFGERMLLEHERNDGLGIDALVIVLIKR